MDKAMQTMIENLKKNTGRSLEEWVTLVKAKNFEKHGEVVKFLKEEQGLTHGYANLIAHTAKNSGTDATEDKDALIEAQYKGKENLRPVYQRLMEAIASFGNDVEVAPKKTYVSLRRSKQFATLVPATKTRFEVGLNLRGQTPEGKLEAEKPNAMCTHKIKLESAEDIDNEVLQWIRQAYDRAAK